MQTRRRLLQVVAWIATTTFGTTNVLAGPVNLTDTPLVTGLGNVVSPNIFFIFDDSLSMNSEYMPDSISTGFFYNFSTDTRLCVRNFGYNTIYYNPNTTYEMPKDPDGTDRSYVPSYTSALPNGYATSGTAVDLSETSPLYGDVTVALPSNAFKTYVYTSTSSQRRRIVVTHPGHGLSSGDEVTFTGTPTSGNLGSSGVPWSNITNHTFSITYINANSYYFSQGTAATASATVGGTTAQVTYTGVVGSTPDYYYSVYTSDPDSPPSTCEDDDDYTKTAPSGSTAQQNFAIWYSYYRSRMSMMKSAAGRAFVGLSDSYRVGFTTISEKSTGSTKFLDIKKFDTDQKDDWFTMLYGVSGVGYTPLRAALSKAGRLYAGKFADPSTGDHDPVQYSCQKNFTILTTDGFWNTDNESPTSDSTTPGLASANYGPFMMDNVTRVGDQDGGLQPPFKDSLAKQNTLADVAYYYNNTDLRSTGSIGGVTDDGSRIDVSTNNVPTSSSDPNAFQHMTTFTLGLGLDGTLANPGDYASILDGSKNWPDAITATTPGSLRESRRIDDLWHAAVNGRGADTNGGNMSAKSPDAVVSELSKALQSITAVTGSASAAATSNLQPVSGDNTAFIAQFKSVAWTGELVARSIDVITGEVPTTNEWSAQTLLDAKSAASRNIYTFKSTSGSYGYRRDFTAANLTSEISAGYFNASALPQYSSYIATQLANATPTNMIDYLRGTRTYENTGGFSLGTDVFREREHVLGDVVSAAPVFVRKPPFVYADAGYTDFLTTVASRLPTVYVGANDGMLHAFDGSIGESGSGTERWAYIPSMLLPDLYKLAASDYSLNHRFYVDGPITAGDAYSGSAWSTILVGGLGGGGKGYYALDVTDPASPKVLWEFGTAADFSGDLSFDADMGYSYGNAVITKRASDDQWVVLFASGYNNSSGDKKGRLYVVDAFTGEKLSEIITSTAANEDLSGIARISNYVEDGLKNNVTQYVYAGDLSGALWRFDINGGSAQKLASTSSTAGNQPITVQPELAKVSGHTVVYFGTGRYLGPNDLADAAPSSSVAQAIYAVKDTGTDLGVLTLSGANLVSQTLNASVSPRTSTSNAVDWSSNNGWYITTPVGERFNIDPGLQLGTLVIAANIPETDYCQPTGSSVLYQLSYSSGSVLSSNVFQAQIVGTTQVQLGGSGSGGSVVGGKIVIEAVLADGTTANIDQVSSGGAAGTAIRVNWREIE